MVRPVYQRMFYFGCLADRTLCNPVPIMLLSQGEIRSGDFDGVSCVTDKRLGGDDQVFVCVMVDEFKTSSTTTDRSVVINRRTIFTNVVANSLIGQTRRTAYVAVAIFDIVVFLKCRITADRKYE